MLLAIFLALFADYEYSLTNLDSKVWREREFAQKRVMDFTMSEMFVDRLHAEAKNPKISLEKKVRVDYILKCYYDTYFACSIGKMPWIDGIVVEKVTKDNGHDVMQKYLHSRFPSYGGYCSEYYPWRNATSDYLWDKIQNDRWTKRQCRDFLEALVVKELEYRRQNNLHNNTGSQGP
jgi:hypothetical protein